MQQSHSELSDWSTSHLYTDLEQENLENSPAHAEEQDGSSDGC